MTEFQPTFPAEVPFTDAELAFMDESPPGIFPENQNSNFGFIIRKIFSDRVQDLINQLDLIYNEKFVLTSTQYLSEWEENVGLPVNTGLFTTAQRRNLILNRLRKGAFTHAMRRAVIESFITATFGTSPGFDLSGIPFDSSGIPLYSGVNSIIGTYRVYEDIRNFNYAVWIKNTVSPDFAGMTRELLRITPAGISFTIDSSQSNVLRYSGIVMNSAPAGYWRLGTLGDDSGNGFSLTANGGVTAGGVAPPGLLQDVTVAGNEGATTFDGTDDYFSRAAPALIAGAKMITLEGWVKINAFAANNHHRIIVGQAGRYMSIYTIGGLNYLNFSLFIDGVQQYLTVPFSFATGTTHYVVGTYDGKVMRVYIDGVYAGSLTITGYGSLDVDGNPVLIGAYSGPTEFMNGVIDEVAIYNHALSATEILDHYNTGKDIATY